MLISDFTWIFLMPVVFVYAFKFSFINLQNSDENEFSLFLPLQEAVKLKPTFADAYLNLGNVYKVSCHALCHMVG